MPWFKGLVEARPMIACFARMGMIVPGMGFKAINALLKDEEAVIYLLDEWHKCKRLETPDWKILKSMIRRTA